MTVDEIQTKIEELKFIEGAEVFNIGYSLLNRPITAIHIGSYSGPQILIQGAIHAREYITSLLLIELVKFTSTQRFSGGFYFVPLMNPDGVALVLEGKQSVRCDVLKQYLTNINGGSEDFSLWKANANAVDLNVNFNADWGEGRQNVFCPAPANFVGYYPESEREVRTLINFAQNIKPSMTISYHSRGEVIYYGFTGQTEAQLERDLLIASNIAEVTGYTVERSFGSVAGFKDWTTRYLLVPAVTIEVGSSEMQHPIGEKYLAEIFAKNQYVPVVAMNSIQTILSNKRGNRFWRNTF